MTPDEREHLTHVVRLKTQWDAAKAELEAKQKAVGLDVTDVRPWPGKPTPDIPQDTVPLTPERMEEIESLERKIVSLEREFADATGR